MNSEIKYIDIDSLILDNLNPRISEFGITNKSKEQEVIKILWEEMAVNELMYSIVSNKFWDYEPLIVIEDNKQFIAIEGNRRLAAVKLIHKKYDEKIPLHIIERITKELLDQTKTLPCIVVNSREESWKYIGFKHVNGPAKWGSYAKAKYIAEIHNNFKIPLEQIAYQIGDTNKTAQKLFQGLMVLEQANKEKVFSYDDIQANRIYFSHLYTGLQREGIRDFLNIKNAEDEDPNPVPKAKLKDLGQLLEWLYGNKKNESQPVIKSQNPDLKHLDEVLQNSEAVAALRSGESLSYSYEISRPTDTIFEENLLQAKRSLTKAKGILTEAYGGEDSLLRVTGSIADLADSIYNEMEKVYLKVNSKEKKKRISE